MLPQLGKMILIVGLALTAVGAGLLLAGRLGLGKLPGDFSFGGKNWRVYVPIGTCVALSILLTLLMMILSRFRKG